GVENVAVKAGYSLVVCNTDETLEREEHYLNLLLSQQVDGIIAAAASQRWDAIELADLKHMPIVFVDRTFEGMDNRPYIGVNNKHGAYLGTSHLIEHGYRRIGCLAGFQRLSSMRERLAGFEQALRDHNVAIRPDWVVTSPLKTEAGREAARQMLCRPDRPDALFINNNFLTLGTLQTLRSLDMHCPRDIALVGFDDHPWASVAEPPLTVVRQPTLEIGEQAATTLLSLLDAEQLTAPEVILDCELIIRKSCGCHE
ncbi:MAG: substrate-binding domain-containing protein, partial [Anaerolineae bacterium]|nr:substrate-binding domain-containing protein [Anaerolineae bacterium]